MPLDKISGCSAKMPICHDHTPTVSDKIMYVLEKISLAVFGIFAALKNINLFLPYMTAGVGLGIYIFYRDGNVFHGMTPSGCSQGILEQVTGIRFPAPLALGFNVATLLCHIDHHASAFVPI